MSASIYGIRRVCSASTDDILRLLKTEPVKATEHTYDGDELYKALCRDFRWEEPDPEEDCLMIWSEDYAEIHHIDTPDGPGGLFLQWNESPGQKTSVTAFIIETSNFTIKSRI